MEVNNFTPFPAVAWENVDTHKQPHFSCVVRVKYILQPTANKDIWVLRLTPSQDELFGEDKYFQNDPDRPVRYESDFITFKKYTDIIVNANSYSPSGKAERNWSCGVNLISPERKICNSAYLNIKGTHYWEKQGILGWLKSDVKNTKSVALDYSKAYGGCLKNPNAKGFGKDFYLIEDPINPVGTGVTHRDVSPDVFPAHQLEWKKHNSKNNGYPAGFGFINRTSKQRLKYAGTYDKQWLDNQHPYPPSDFDYLHNQAATPELIMNRYIKFGTEIYLENLIDGSPKCRFKIPELYCFSEFISENNHIRREVMNIDTVIIDLEEEQKAVYLSYRCFTPKNNEPKAINFCYLPKEQLEKQK